MNSIAAGTTPSAITAATQAPAALTVSKLAIRVRVTGGLRGFDLRGQLGGPFGPAKQAARMRIDGQRKGLGITTPKPVYVVNLEAETNRVVVGDESDLDRDEFTADRCNWHPFEKLTGPIEVMTKIRYNHPGASATLTPLENGKVKVKLHSPQRAITPGQAAVFYQNDLVLGGGWIMR